MTDSEQATTVPTASAQPGACTPVLRIFDEAAARRFYCDYLGFAVDDVERLLEELQGKAYRYARPSSARQPWGNDLALADPFGNRLIFTDAA